MTIVSPVTSGLPNGVPRPRIPLSVSPKAALEGEGSTPIAVTASVASGTRFPTGRTISIAVSGSGSPTAVEFFPVAGFEIAIPAGAASATGSFDLAPEDDNIDETEEIITVSGTSAGLEVHSASLMLSDDDGPPDGLLLSVDPSTVSEAAGNVPVRVTVRFSGGISAAETPVTVAVDGNGAADPADFAPVDGFVVTIPADLSQGTGSFDLRPVDNLVDEADNHVVVSAASFVLAAAPATVTIAADDVVIVDIRDAVIVEGEEAAVFSVTLEGPSERTVAVAYATSEDTAHEVEDLQHISGLLSIEPGEVIGTIPVPVVEDDEEGTETFSMLLSDPRHAEIGNPEATGTILDNDGRAVQTDMVMSHALAAFGRSVAETMVDRIDGRVSAAGSPGQAVAQLTLAGRGLSLAEDWSEEETAQALGLFADGEGRSVSARELLTGSSFRFSLDDGEGGEGGSWTIWGGGSVAGFEGRPGSGLRLEGEVFSGHLGFDRSVREDLLLGLALNHSEGEIDYRIDGGENGEVEASLTSLHPYAFWGDSDVGAWFQLGYGRGDAARMPDGGDRVESDIEFRMAAVGGHHRLASAAGLDWKLKSDAMHMRLDADDLAPAVSTEVWRLRVNLEGGASKALSAAGERLSGSARIGARLDGGDLESGGGLEIGADVDYVHPGLGIGLEAQGRVLLAHQDGDFENWGIGLAARFDPGEPRRGLHLSVEPEWGETSDRTGDLWEGSGLFDSVADDETAAGDGADNGGSGMRLDALLGYGLDAVGRRGLLTPYAELGWSERNTRLRLGTRMMLMLQDGLEVGLDVHEEREREDDGPFVRDLGIELTVRLRF